jgi:hypothetical protein
MSSRLSADFIYPARKTKSIFDNKELVKAGK